MMHDIADTERKKISARSAKFKKDARESILRLSLLFSLPFPSSFLILSSSPFPPTRTFAQIHKQTCQEQQREQTH